MNARHNESSEKGAAVPDDRTLAAFLALRLPFSVPPPDHNSTYAPTIPYRGAVFAGLLLTGLPLIIMIYGPKSSDVVVDVVTRADVYPKLIIFIVIVPCSLISCIFMLLGKWTVQNQARQFPSPMDIEVQHVQKVEALEKRRML